MIDLGVLRIRDLLTPNEIMVKGSSIYLQVGRVRDIDRVLVDDIEVPYSVSLGMVLLNEEDISTPMDRVEVVYSTYYGRGKTKAEFLLAKEHVLITGRLTLIQDIVRLLLA